MPMSAQEELFDRINELVHDMGMADSVNVSMSWPAHTIEPYGRTVTEADHREADRLRDEAWRIQVKRA